MEKVLELLILLVAAVALAIISGAFWGLIIFLIANYLIGFQITALQAFGGGLIFHFISIVIRKD